MIKLKKLALSVFTIAFALLLFNACEKDAVDNLNDENAEWNSETDGKSYMQLKNAQSDEYLEFECFTVKYPVDITLEDNTVTVYSEVEEFELIENWFNENPYSEDYPEYVFPITIVLVDGTEQVINNDDELYDLYEDCFEGGDIDWDDEEMEDFDCFDFVYPLVMVFPDGSTTQVTNDEEMYTLMEDWFDANQENEEYPTFMFPIEITFDETVETVENEEEFDELFWGDDYEDSFTFVYPLSVINSNGSTIKINNEDELFEYIDNNESLEDIEDITFVFPIQIDFGDGEIETINSQEEFDELFEF